MCVSGVPTIVDLTVIEGILMLDMIIRQFNRSMAYRCKCKMERQHGKSRSDQHQ